jgi:hypothetical protein
MTESKKQNELKYRYGSPRIIWKKLKIIILKKFSKLPKNTAKKSNQIKETIHEENEDVYKGMETRKKEGNRNLEVSNRSENSWEAFIIKQKNQWTQRWVIW